eukprot:scaffold40943_cov37-Phaeocystis_antarctica.AAC.2
MDGVAQLPVPTFVLALTNRRVRHRGLEPQASRQGPRQVLVCYSHVCEPLAFDRSSSTRPYCVRAGLRC